MKHGHGVPGLAGGGSMNRLGKTIAVFLLLWIPAFSAVSAFERVIVDDTPHLMNTDQPRDGIARIRLEEEWRLGSDDGDLIFGLVTRIDEDDAGNLYVMDAQLSQVHVFDSNGRQLGTLFGEGDGPGEVRGPRDMLFMPDGRIGVVQEMPGKLIFVAPNGDPSGSLAIAGSGAGGSSQTFSAFADKDLLLVTGFLQGQGSEPGHFNQTNFLASFDAQGNRLTPFCEVTHDIDFSNFTFDENKHLAGYWWNTSFGPDGRVYTAPRLDSYEIHCFARSGVLDRVIKRDYDPWRRSAAEKQYFKEVVQAIYHGAPIEISVTCSEFEPVILYMHRGLRVSSDGTIWVLTTRGVRDQPPGLMASFDLFAPSGEFVQQLEVAAPWDGRRDGVFFFGDHAFVVTGYADAMMAQFTGGRMGIDLSEGDSSIEVIRCRVVAEHL